MTDQESDDLMRDRMLNQTSGVRVYPTDSTPDDYVAAIITEREKLKAENARLREALKNIQALDKTEYDYGTPDRNGRLPDGVGQRWKEPREIAREALQKPSADDQKEKRK